MSLKYICCHHRAIKIDTKLKEIDEFEIKAIMRNIRGNVKWKINEEIFLGKCVSQVKTNNQKKNKIPEIYLQLSLVSI